MSTPNYPPPGGPRPPGPPPPPGQQPPPPPYGQVPPGPPPPGAPPPPPPYGQVPPGAPPPPGPPGQPPASPPYPSAPPPSRGGSNKKVLQIVGGLVVVAVIIGAVLFFNRNAASSAEVGDCIKVISASSVNAEVEKIDCGSDEAIYKVAKKLDSSTATCPSDAYNSYSEEDRFTLCLALNVKQGDCLGGVQSPETIKRVNCAAAEIAVVKVVDGQADESLCPEQAQQVVTYPEPPQTVCFGRPGGTTGT